VGTLRLVRQRAWIVTIVLLAAAIWSVVKWLRGLDYEDDELWDFEEERLLDQTLLNALARGSGQGMPKHS
jgi:hypothetical protein